MLGMEEWRAGRVMLGVCRFAALWTLCGQCDERGGGVVTLSCRVCQTGRDAVVAMVVGVGVDVVEVGGCGVYLGG
jgi:hypothetical protein